VAGTFFSERGQIVRGHRPGLQERRRGVTPCWVSSRHEDAVGHGSTLPEFELVRKYFGTVGTCLEAGRPAERGKPYSSSG